ncbi:asparagine synthase (glutamine-hydrolysing) [Paramicrobacterium agarici]|uniref:Asparagine synthase (Glutamine-hydrolysing) n=2 Tax=Paramicrobacterium agarici TaxID=630514 RepID=A0A2A9DX15_9MICO|nr:asparagine synthase (glutamine-hydrolysing) [Microbacterium agarici]
MGWLIPQGITLSESGTRRTAERPSAATYTMNDFVRLRPEEQAFAFPSGEPFARTAEHKQRSATPRVALEQIVKTAFTGIPVYVLFSGGRDSSAILALATAIARSLDADDPIPVTVKHPDAPRSDESDWQDLVLEHLSIRERIVLEFRGEQSLLSEAAQAGLTAHGLLWPSALQLHGAIYTKLVPGVLLTGEGGDLVIEGRRITPLSEAVRNIWVRTSLREAYALVAHRGNDSDLTSALVARSPWLTREGQRRLTEVIHSAKEPLAWNRSLRALVDSRPASMARANFAAVARAHGHSPLSPFDDERFFRALERTGGYWGFGGRTQMMRALFHDLLPDAILSRTTKAAFNETRWLEPEREFARSWNGDGVDHDLIDPERLRSEWLGESPSTHSTISLHAAWLAQNNLPVVPHAA